MKVLVLTGCAVSLAAFALALTFAQTPSSLPSGAQSPSDKQMGQGSDQGPGQGPGGRPANGPGNPNDGYGGYKRVWTTYEIHTTVLPKYDTPKQLAAIMLQWREAIADHGHCVTCHSWSKDPKRIMSNGFPEIDPYDDSKPEYRTARQMYLMTQSLNQRWLGWSKEPVTCGTCHRGHLIPQAYVPLPLPMGPPAGQPANRPGALTTPNTQ